MINRPPSSRIAPSECFYRHNGNLRTTPVKLSASPKCAKNGHGDAAVVATVAADPYMHHLMHLIQPRSACTNMRTGAAVCQRPRCLARVQAGGAQGTPQLLSPPTGTRRARQRLVGAVPFGKWPITGLRRAAATAPAVFEGAINCEMFLLPSRALALVGAHGQPILRIVLVRRAPLLPELGDRLKRLAVAAGHKARRVVLAL